MNFGEFKEKKQQFDDSRIGSIIRLSIWIILLIIFASFVRTDKSDSFSVDGTTGLEIVSKPTSESVKDKFKSISSYDASVIVDGDLLENIRLTNYNDKFLLFYNGEKYYKSDSLYLLSTHKVVDNKLLSDVIYYSVVNICDYLENVDEDYFTIYKDNSFSIGYTIYNMSFDDSMVNVVISGNDNIDKVEIYFDNFYINSIVFNLSNVNNIEYIEVD